MKIIIQTLDFELSDELKRYIENALSKPVSISAAIRHAEVILYEEKVEGRSKKYCSIRAVLPGDSCLVARCSDSCEGAILLAVDELLGKLINDFSWNNSKSNGL